MECADLLHVLWAGICRDFSGSLILDTAEWCNLASLQGSGWDERLQTLHNFCMNWCASHGIRPSTVEPLSPLNFFGLLQHRGYVSAHGQTCSMCIIRQLPIHFHFSQPFFLRLAKARSGCDQLRLSPGPFKGLCQPGFVSWCVQSWIMLQLRGLGLEH